MAHYLKSKFQFDCGDSYFRLNANESAQAEIRRKLAGKNNIPETRLAEVFPYIDKAFIKDAAQNLGYRQLKNGDLFLPDSRNFEASEWKNESSKIIGEIREKGYFLLSSLGLDETRANYEGLSDAAFRADLEKNLDKLGLRIIGPAIIASGSKISLPRVISEYCRKLESFSYDMIEEEFGPDVKSLKNLPDVLQKSAIQTEENRFVNIKSICFDVKAIDKKLVELIRPPIMALSLFTSFSLLPAVPDNRWNSYLLQSYCLHASEKFGIVRPTPNNICMGMIYPKFLLGKSRFAYNDLVAVMAVLDKVIPDKQILREYLDQKKFFARIRDDTIADILERMAKMK